MENSTKSMRKYDHQSNSKKSIPMDSQRFYDKIERFIWKCFRKDAYKELETELKRLPKPVLLDFCQKEGKNLIDYSLVKSSSKPFAFLIEHIPHDITIEAIYSGDKCRLQEYFGAQLYIETYWDLLGKDKIRNTRREILYLIYQVDEQRFMDFVKENEHQQWITDSMKEDINIFILKN